MDERLVAVVKGFLPEGSEVTKIYKDALSEIKADIILPGGAGNMTCSLKKPRRRTLLLNNRAT